MRKVINRIKLTNIILHSLATDHLSRQQLMRTVIMAYDNISDRYISYHLNYMIDLGLIHRFGKTSKQHYELTNGGYVRYLELLSNNTNVIRVI